VDPTRPPRLDESGNLALTESGWKGSSQRFRSRFRFAAIFRDARRCLATYGTQAIAAVQIIAMIAASAAARCRWRMRDTESVARTRVETRGSKDS